MVQTFYGARAEDMGAEELLNIFLRHNYIYSSHLSPRQQLGRLRRLSFPERLENVHFPGPIL